MHRLLLLALPILALSACATMSVEQRVENKLVEAGLNPPMARCMAHRMVDKLSVSQLRQLSQFAGLRHQDGSTLTVDELAYRLRALNDPEIFAVVASAGLKCAIAA
ncbi:hypothetical protein [Flavisphingomonas formosensis]|uniref:hypothetical protein n=1 Tax=Flavisphingomonas formosensis TaxID=861534 RepID=UPI0012F7DA98|nr:hypothetical protein [Sphingomonas formosensis]